MRLLLKGLGSRRFQQYLVLIVLIFAFLVIIDVRLANTVTFSNQGTRLIENSINANGLEPLWHGNKKFCLDEAIAQVNDSSNQVQAIFPISGDNSKFSQLSLSSKNMFNYNPNFLPKSLFSQDINQTYLLRHSNLTPQESSTFFVTSGAKLRNITIDEETSPELRFDISYLMNPQWSYSEDFSEGVASDNFSLYFINSTNYSSKSLSALHVLSSSSNESTPLFFASRSLQYNFGILRSNFSHVTRYPTSLSLNLSLHDFSFTSPIQGTVPSEKLFRMGLKFKSDNILNNSLSGGIFYIVWNWSGYFAPTPTPMLAVYNASIGRTENGPVFYFPKNLSISSDSRLYINVNLTKLLRDLAEYNSSDNFDWEKVQYYFDSLSEIVFEWLVIAQDVPENSTLQIQFSLDDIKLFSRIPKSFYSWKASVNNFNVSFSQLSSTAYAFSMVISLNSSSVNVIFDVQISDDSNRHFLFWDITVQYTISLRPILIWKVNPLVTSNFTTSGSISKFTLEGNITHDFFDGNVTIPLELLSVVVPLEVEIRDYAMLLSSTSSDSSPVGIPQVYMDVKEFNKSHKLLLFSITTNQASLDEFSSYYLHVEAMTSNKMGSVLFDSNIVMKGDDWVMEGSIIDYFALSGSVDVLDVVIYQNVSGNFFDRMSNLTVELSGSGYFIVYLSKNLTNSLIEGRAQVILHWDAKWFQGLSVVSVIIMSSSSTPLSTSISSLHGTSVYQFDSWTLSGELNVPQKYANSSAMVDLLLLDDDQKSSDGLQNQSTMIVLNRSFFITKVSSWYLYLGSASLMPRNYSLITVWRIKNGITFYNMTTVSILPSTVIFIPDKLIQPSYEWLSLEVRLMYAINHTSFYYPLVSEQLKLTMTLNDSYSVTIDALVDPNGTVIVIWSNLPDYWLSFNLKWHLIGIQGMITNGSLVLTNQHETDSSSITINDTYFNSSSNSIERSLLFDAILIAFTVTLPIGLFYYKKKNRSVSDFI